MSFSREDSEDSEGSMPKSILRRDNIPSDGTPPKVRNYIMLYTVMTKPYYEQTWTVCQFDFHLVVPTFQSNLESQLTICGPQALLSSVYKSLLTKIGNLKCIV